MWFLYCFIQCICLKILVFPVLLYMNWFDEITKEVGEEWCEEIWFDHLKIGNLLYNSHQQAIIINNGISSKHIHIRTSAVTVFYRIPDSWVAGYSWPVSGTRYIVTKQYRSKWLNMVSIYVELGSQTALRHRCVTTIGAVDNNIMNKYQNKHVRIDHCLSRRVIAAITRFGVFFLNIFSPSVTRHRLSEKRVCQRISKLRQNDTILLLLLLHTFIRRHIII